MALWYIKWPVRVIAALIGLFAALVVIALIALSNINVFAPYIVGWINDATDYQVSVERIGVDLFTSAPTLTAKRLSLTHDNEQHTLHAEAEDVEVRAAVSAALSGAWRIERLRISQPRISGAVRQAAERSQTQRNQGLPVGFVSALARIENLSVDQGRMDIDWDLSDTTVSVNAAFELNSMPTPDGYAILGRAATTLYNESTVEFELDVAEARGGRDSATQLNVDIAQLDLAWLKFANIPRVPLADVRTVVNAKLRANWQDSKLIGASWDATAQDPDLAAGMPGVAVAAIAASGAWTPGASAGESGALDAEIQLQGLDFVSLLRQYQQSFPPKFHLYMSKNLESLWVPQAKATIRVDNLRSLADLEIEAAGEFVNLNFAYSDKLPPVENGSGAFELLERKFEARLAQGTVYGQAAKDVHAVIEDILVPEPDMILTGSMQVPVDKAIALFGAEGSAIPGKLSLIRDGDGEVSASAKFVVPMRRAREFAVDGSIDLNGASAILSNGATLSDLRGVMKFGRYGILSGALTASAFGGRSEVAFTGTSAPGQWEITGTSYGDVDPSQLGPVLGPAIPAHLGGSGSYKASYEVRKGEFEAHLSSNLIGVEAQLPAPLAKQSEEIWMTVIDVRRTSPVYQEVDIQVDSLLGASLAFSKESGRWEITQGAAGLGAKQPPVPDGGIALNVIAPTIDLDGWMKIGNSPKADRENAFGLENLKQLNATTGTLVLSRQRPVQQVEVSYAATDSGWRMNLSGDQIAGVMEYRNHEGAEDEQPELIVSMSKCHLPEAAGEKSAAPVDPRSLPAIIFACDDLVFGKYNLGKARLAGKPSEDGWKIHSSSFDAGALNIGLTGNWDSLEDHQRTQLSIRFKSDDFGQAMEELGYKDLISQGTASLEATLSWNDALTNWSAADTFGNASFRADDGAFLKSNSAGAKVLGLFEFGSLLRRLTVDFGDTFKSGYQFEKIRGAATVDSGLITVDKMTVAGEGADMVIAGTSDWENETHDLIAFVEPKITSAIPTLITTIAGLPAGVLAYLLQKRTSKDEALQKEIATTRYSIKGPWSDVAVEPIPVASSQ